MIRLFSKKRPPAPERGFDPEAEYACVNYGEAFCPARIEDRSVCINGDIYETLLGIKA